MSRIKNSQRNIVYGFIGQFIKIFVKFALRTIVIYILGAVYLGLDGLFLNVISILSLAELGIGDAVCFALYKPITENDNEKINAYMLFYKRVYMIIGFVILILGCTLLPFLDCFVNFDYEVDVNYYLIYILFLINSVSSYWFGAYRQVLFIANQQSYIINKANNMIIIVNAVAQTAVLIVFKNYYFYLLVMILTGIMKNILLYTMSNKMFEYINTKPNTKLEKNEKKELLKNVYALTLTKISSTIYTSSDNLIISTFVGTVIVGYYSNYSYIVAAVTGFISILFSSVVAGVGNINAEHDEKHMHTVFKRLLFINFWIYGFCFICFWQLMSPFVNIWAGSEYVLSDQTVFVISLMFLIPGLNHTCTIYRAACGLFWQTRYRTMLTAIINIVTSVLLVGKLGLTGVFLGTIISYLLTTFIVDPAVLYREIFKISQKEFYCWYIKSLIIIIGTGIITKGLCNCIMADGIWGFAIQAAVCALFPNAVFCLLFRKDENFSYYRSVLKNTIQGLKRRKNV